MTEPVNNVFSIIPRGDHAVLRGVIAVLDGIRAGHVSNAVIEPLLVYESMDRCIEALEALIKPAAALTLQSAPIGTLAPAIGGGRWCKVERGWKWNGPDGTGGTFPRPGGDWNGKLVHPEVAQNVVSLNV